MPHKPLIRSHTFPYHVFHRCNNREQFHLPMERVWDLISCELYRISILYGAKIHAFVLMSNHYHMILSTPEADLAKVMEEFGKSITRTFNQASGRSGHLFGGRYKWSLIQSPLHYAHVLKYVNRNPVRAEIVPLAEDYAYSSLHGLVGQAALPFPISLPIANHFGSAFVPQDYELLLAWLNRPTPKEEQEAIQKALRRKIFELPKDPKTGKRNPLEYEEESEVEFTT